jgi:hypothetical protein
MFILNLYLCLSLSLQLPLEGMQLLEQLVLVPFLLAELSSKKASL